MGTRTTNLGQPVLEVHFLEADIEYRVTSRNGNLLTISAHARFNHGENRRFQFSLRVVTSPVATCRPPSPITKTSARDTVNDLPAEMTWPRPKNWPPTPELRSFTEKSIVANMIPAGTKVNAAVAPAKSNNEPIGPA